MKNQSKIRKGAEEKDSERIVVTIGYQRKFSREESSGRSSRLLESHRRVGMILAG